ncbi:hypothetical protein AN958_12691 [Leucoagaricus sp. SymC.cos]|nr:hypothetical protein AN958_12691 [Leucoagaricus sp. SymC.cos]
MLLVRFNHGSYTSLQSFSTKPMIRIPKSPSIHPFDYPSNQWPTLRDVDWEINKGTLLDHLHVLIDSTSISRDGIFPFLGQYVDPYSHIISVFNNVHWQIRQGERWHLRGANGSGKTTLMSLILGDHPQSYVLPYPLLPSPQHTHTPLSTSTSKPSTQYILDHSQRISTPHLRQTIGVVSPELFDAFPCCHPGMTVREAIGTGFKGVFVPLSGNGIGATNQAVVVITHWEDEVPWTV